ncbi:conjugal transfer protein TraP, partial [Salmonella enterica subsp. enterica serovar Enteritidis]
LKGRAVLYRIAGLLRWLIWGVKYAIIWPLATTAIVVILLFRTGDTTPGQQMAQEIGRVRAMAPSGMFPVRDCPDPVFTVSSPVPLNLTENCPLKITGAEEYAADIDQSLSQTGWLLWGMLALLYTAVAVMIGDRPYRHNPLTYAYDTATNNLKYIDKENEIRTLKENTNGQVYYSGNKEAEKEGDKNEHT